MKSNQRLTILLWQWKSKVNEKGLAPIYCRLSIDGQKEEIATGIKAHINEWDGENKKVKGSSSSKQKNSRLNQIATDLERQFTILQLNYEHITPLMLKNAYRGLPANLKKGDPKPIVTEVPTLLEVADMNIDSLGKMVDKGLKSYETLKQWRATRKKLEEFLIIKYKNPILRINEIEFSFATDFYQFLTVERTPLLAEASAK